MKILHTADWHLGTFRSPVKDGVNLRTEDTKRCLDELIRVANEEKPDYSLVSGDIFHVGRLWSDRCCEEIITAIHYIRELAAVSKQVVVMRGTPNHDGSGQFNVLSEMFADVPNVHVVITPQVFHLMMLILRCSRDLTGECSELIIRDCQVMKKMWCLPMNYQIL